MSFVEAIARKRDGLELEPDHIQQFVQGAAENSLPAEQLAAMLMAICCRGMTHQETLILTRQMLRSGESWEVGRLRPSAVDKHSTGGVGDTVSLVLAPLLASVDVPVAMMAGRGLGHSQGTIDKLEAIPGFECGSQRRWLIEVLDRCKAAISQQSERIAPADRTLYALRDITGTVPSLPLIVGSIMSKKLALGTATLVLDVKWGTGAFRKTVEEAVELALALRSVARGSGVQCEAVLTDMNQPLGPALGTACEVRAALDVLEGGGSPRLREVTLALAEEALVLGNHDRSTARSMLEQALNDGSARRQWDEIVHAHGGDPDPDRLASPAAVHAVPSPTEGWIAAVDGEGLGWVAVEVGAGRRRLDEPLAHGAGVEVSVRIGDRVEAGQPLGRLLVGDRPVDTEDLTARIARSFTISPEPVAAPRLVLGPPEAVSGASD